MPSMNPFLSDLRLLFTQWGKYYSLPLHWGKRQWILFAGFVFLVFIAAYFDEPIRYLFFGFHGHVEDAVCKFVHWFGTGWANLYLLVGFYALGVALQKEKLRFTGVMILQSYLYSGAITIGLKSLVGRWRPAAGHGHLTFSPFVTTPNAYLSFPSGDVAVVFSLAIVMMSLSKNIFWKSAWIVLAILTSLSRIYYNAHWFSDIVFSTVNAVIAGMWVVKERKNRTEGYERA